MAKKSMNKNLHSAKHAKKDEFYTQISDIEKELVHYKGHFEDKVIFCNCDDPTWSHFWKYFELNFRFFGLKKLIATHYRYDGQPSYKLEMNRDDPDSVLMPVETTLNGNGDFRSDECVEILKEADIVVTNPPFSLFREYIAQLVEYDKKFIIIGNKNAITYKETFKFLKDDKVWLGYTSPKEFVKDDGNIQKFGNIGWFTNLEIKKRYEDIILYRTYNEQDYPKYDNYDAIEVSKTKDIPMDYDGAMGVPITFLDKYNPDQFEILGITDRANTSGLRTKKYTKTDSHKFNDLNARSVLKIGKNEHKAVYARIIIKRK